MLMKTTVTSSPSLAGTSGITLDSLRVSYHGNVVLKPLSLTIEPGEVLALIGPSGSGKTTVLRAIAGFVQPAGGRILIGDTDVTQLPPYKRGLAMVVQNYALFPQNNNKIDAVVASNDATAGGAIQALTAQGLAGKVAISGQDADLAGVKRIISGTQTMTVYKPITTLATNAAEIAVELGNDKQPKADTTLNNGLKDVPSRLLTPIEVNKENIDATVIKDGFHKKSEL